MECGAPRPPPCIREFPRNAVVPRAALCASSLCPGGAAQATANTKTLRRPSVVRETPEEFGGQVQASLGQGKVRYGKVRYGRFPPCSEASVATYLLYTGRPDGALTHTAYLLITLLPAAFHASGQPLLASSSTEPNAALTLRHRTLLAQQARGRPRAATRGRAGWGQKEQLLSNDQTRPRPHTPGLPCGTLLGNTLPHALRGAIAPSILPLAHARLFQLPRFSLLASRLTLPCHLTPNRDR